MNQPGQVPDHRLREMSETMRKLEEQNRQLKSTLDQVMLNRQPPQTQQAQKLFDDSVDNALNQKFQELVRPFVEQTKQQVGYLHDRNDYLEFSNKYGKDALEQHRDEIERLRQDAQQRGQWISREDAYKHVYFEKNSKKPKEEPQAPQGPVFDPYLGKYVDAPQTPATQPQTANAQAPVVTQAPEVSEPVLPALPPQAMNQHIPATKQGALNLDLGTSEADLDAWADKYGDNVLP